MGSNCDLVCFNTCAFPMNVSSGDPINFKGDLDSMARCMTHVCQLDYLGKNTTELVQIYQQLSAMAPFMNDTVALTNCTYTKPKVTFEREMPKYAVPILGYLSPIIILLTIVNNTLVFIVLMKPHMRSPTNAILVAMALSDSLFGLCFLPIFLHFHATERFYEWLPYNWCYPYDIVGKNLPIITHAVSVWLTVTLAVQRYICVCHPFKARTWCTVRNAIYGTAVICIVSTLGNITLFFEGRYVETEIPSLLRPNQYVSACIAGYQPFLERNLFLYLYIYFGFLIIFVKLLPCLILTVMNALLINTLRVARRRRKELVGQHKNSQRRKLEESNRTTLMLVVVVSVFLLVEAPVVMDLLFWVMHEHFDITAMDGESIALLMALLKFCLLLSYPTNFFIYCSMCKKFRDTFKQLFVCSSRPLRKNESPHMVVSTLNRSLDLGGSVD